MPLAPLLTTTEQSPQVARAITKVEGYKVIFSNKRRAVDTVATAGSSARVLALVAC